MKNLKSFVNWHGIVGAISLFILIAFSVVIGHLLADYLSFNPLDRDVQQLFEQHHKLCLEMMDEDKCSEILYPK